MSTHMKSLSYPSSSAWSRTCIEVFVGSLFLAFCAQIAIPMYPVPMSLQTLGVFLLGIFLGGKKAGLATLLYLVEATIGLPVLAGGEVDPLWFLGTRAGYLLGFPVAAYLIGMLAHKNQKRVSLVVLSIFCGQLVIYSLGILFLCRFFSLKSAITLGLFPFLPLAALKLLIASSLSGLYLRFKSR